jgi:hypothetical protein
MNRHHQVPGFYGGYPVTDSFLDCVNIIGGLSVMQDIAIAAHTADERPEFAERARERAGYGGLDRHNPKSIRPIR